MHTQVRVAADAGGFKGDDLCALLVVILNALKEFIAEHHARLQQQRVLDEPVLGALQLCAVRGGGRLGARVDEGGSPTHTRPPKIPPST